MTHEQFFVSTLPSTDIDCVEALRRQNGSTLGFMPLKALGEYLDRKTALGIKSGDGCLAGYLLYASYPDRVRIAHLCISDKFRKKGLAKKLFEALKEKCVTQQVIQLNCRRDYVEANHVWRKLGFIPIHEKPGRSQDGRPLTKWQYRIRPDTQLDVFNQEAPEHTLKIVIDTHILIHLHAPPSPESLPSKSLSADFLADLIQIHLVDEVFHEVNRQENLDIRTKTRHLAHLYPVAVYDEELAKSHENSLKTLLRTDRPSDKSDIRHLAKTAASGIGVFVTQDGEMLKQSDAIKQLTGLEVIAPVDLTLRLHEEMKEYSYRRSPVSGQNLIWRRARANDIEKLLKVLLRPDESKGKLQETLLMHLSRPRDCKFEILFFQEQILGARVSTKEKHTVTVSFIRAARSDKQGLIEQFLISDILSTCAAMGLPVIQIMEDELSEDMKEYLLEMGFGKAGHNFERLCLTGSLTRAEVTEKANSHIPDVSSTWESLSDQEILMRVSPVVLKDSNESCFIIPIRPAYAMSLFNKQSAQGDVFGGRSNILMCWENAYFRSKAQHLILQAPARVLWYESGEIGAITACSHLRSVEIGLPKPLFRKYNTSGTLDWPSIFEMCKKNIQREIMVLSFSHTFAFRKPITLGDLREMEGRNSVPLQSPRKIDSTLFLKIIEIGYAEMPK